MTPDKLGVAFGLIALVDGRGKERTRYVVDLEPAAVIKTLPKAYWRVERPAADARLTPRSYSWQR